MKKMLIPLIFLSFILSIQLSSSSSVESQPPTVCIVGSGISGASVAHFLRKYSSSSPLHDAQIRIFERHGVIGGRMATVTLAGETFEAGGSILHPKNYHVLDYTQLLNLTVKVPSSSSSFAIWDGQKFVFKTLSTNSNCPHFQKIVSFANSLLIFFRYGFSLFKMDKFVERTVSNFLKYYESLDTRPVFSTVDEMLKWADLYNLTTRTLHDELVDAKLSPLLIQELVTVITRINYGQSVSMSGLGGAVSLAGSGGGLWSVEEGNWQMAAGLVNRSRVDLHLNEQIESISYLEDHYELNSTKGNTYTCTIAVVATPLDEIKIRFTPAISIPKRNLQHTHATFVRGFLNLTYFGLKASSVAPDLVATIENPDLPFTSISILKKHSVKDASYKIFSRKPVTDALLDSLFSERSEVIRLNWGAYPQYNAPEKFAPFILDGKQLYYVNAFENAASTMETGAVAAENVARLILSRFPGHVSSLHSSMLKSPTTDTYDLHSDL